MDNFQEIILRSAVLAMAIDGEIHEKEIEYLNNYINNNINFFIEEIEIYIDKIVNEFNENKNEYLNQYNNSILVLSLSKSQKLQLLDIVIEIVQSDGKTDEKEIEFINNILKILKLDSKFLISRYPQYINIFLSTQKSDINKFLPN